MPNKSICVSIALCSFTISTSVDSSAEVALLEATLAKTYRGHGLSQCTGHQQPFQFCG